MVWSSSHYGDLGNKRMLNQDTSREVVPLTPSPVPFNMQQPQYYPQQQGPSPFVYPDGGTSLQLEMCQKPYLGLAQQWQETGFMSGNYLPQQPSGPPGSAAQQMRINLPTGPPQQGPPPTQPTPTSTPPGVDMKQNHMPGQTQMQQGNMYSNQQRPNAGNQNFTSFQQVARMSNPRVPRNNGQGPNMGNNIPNMYPISYLPFPQTMMVSVPTVGYPTQQFQNPRHQGQNSSQGFYQTNNSIIVGSATGHQYYPQNFSYPVMRHQFIQPNPAVGPAPQSGAPQGPLPSLNTVPSGILPISQQPVSSQEPKKKRTHAIPIIDPDTGNDIFNDQPGSGNNNNITPPRSNESSARETPQPEVDKKVALDFAAMVASAAESPSISQTDMSEPPVVESISSDIDSVHKQPVPNSEINIPKVSHQLQTNVKNFVPKSQVLQQQQHHHQHQPVLPQVQPMQHIHHMTEPALPSMHIKEEVRQSGATPIVSAVTNSPAVEIHRGDRQHKEFSNLGKSTQLSMPSSIVQSPNRAPSRKQKTSESEHQAVQNNQPLSPTLAQEPQLPSSALESAQTANKKGHKGGQKEETVVAPPKERREKPRSISKEQTPPATVESPVTPPSVMTTPVPAKVQSQFHTMKSIEGFTSLNIIPTSLTATEDAPVAIKQQANGEPHVTGDLIDGGNKASQKTKKNKGKMKVDLNRKGNEKEGTDMDAFTGPAITIADDREQATSSPPASPTVPLKSATPPQPSPPPENKIKDDLEEREEKLVAAKNEENTKVSAIDIDEENKSQIIEKLTTQVSLKYNYKDGQWSPVNPEGKRKYERDFLMELKNEPQSRKKPENFPDWDAILKDTSNRQPRSSGVPNMFNLRQHDMIAPQFMYSRSSNSQRGGKVSKSGSQQGKIGKGGKPNVIHMSLSLHEDVKLRESENAWKPKVRNLGGSENLNQEQKESEELYKKVRGILNKLTPQKFHKLMAQVKNLPINTVERLEKVIDLVFEKAVDEPGFSKAYAEMCKLLSELEVSHQNEEGKDVKHNFRKLIITRCQSEFESEKHAELDVEKRLEEIRNCDDPEKKKELQILFEEDERRVRMKSVGNVRFIGELFKLNMLTSSIMFRCLNSMLKKPEEESLECLCKLLTTIGRDLESKDSAQLNPIFSQMSHLSHKQENSKISSRVRFMLQDVIDLRKSKWVPRRDENNPKTMEQITKDAERETIEMNIALSQPRSKNYESHSDDRRGGRGNRNNQSEDGWMVSTGKNSYRSTNLFDQSKLSSMRKDLDTSEISLGSSNQYRNFSNLVSNVKADKISTNNFYSALRNDDRKPPPSNITMNKMPNRVTPSPSMEKERMMYPGPISSFDGKLSRGNSLQRDRPMQSSQPQSRDNSVPRQIQPTTPVPSSRLADNLSEDDIKRHSRSIIEEYLSVKDVKDCKLNIEEKFSHKSVVKFLSEAFEQCLEVKSQQSRVLIGNLMVELLSTNVATSEHVVEALTVLIESGEDISIDVPKFWEYLADVMVPIVCAEKLSFADVRSAASSILKNPVIEKLLIPIFKVIVKLQGPDFAQKYLAVSKVSLYDFLPPDSVETFVKENNLEFLTGGMCNTSSSLPMDEAEQMLIRFIKNQSSFESIKSWISANVGAEKTREALFIRTLVTAVCTASLKESSSSKNISLDEKLFKDYGKLIHVYVDNNEELELTSLNAIQTLITKLEHPQGLLVNIFNTLWEDGVLSNESFLKWRDGEEVEGKGVSLKSLVSFFVALEEAESDDETS